jgi:hypothetical protein
MLRRFVGKGFLFALTVNLTLFLSAIKASYHALCCVIAVTPHTYMMAFVPLVVIHLTTLNHFGLGFMVFSGEVLPFLSITYSLPSASLCDT